MVSKQKGTIMNNRNEPLRWLVIGASFFLPPVFLRQMDRFRSRLVFSLTATKHESKNETREQKRNTPKKKKDGKSKVKRRWSAINTSVMESDQASSYRHFFWQKLLFLPSFFFTGFLSFDCCPHRFSLTETVLLTLTGFYRVLKDFEMGFVFFCRFFIPGLTVIIVYYWLYFHRDLFSIRDGFYRLWLILPGFTDFIDCFSICRVFSRLYRMLLGLQWVWLGFTWFY